MTLAECKAHTANDASMWIASRFAMCESRWFAAEWSVNGKVVGFTQMTVSAIATVPAADSREIYFDYYFSDFYAVSTNAIDATLVGADPNYVTAPDNIALTQGGLDPGPVVSPRSRPTLTSWCPGGQNRGRGWRRMTECGPSGT